MFVSLCVKTVSIPKIPHGNFAFPFRFSFLCPTVHLPQKVCVCEYILGTNLQRLPVLRSALVTLHFQLPHILVDSLTLERPLMELGLERCGPCGHLHSSSESWDLCVLSVHSRSVQTPKVASELELNTYIYLLHHFTKGFITNTKT